MKGKHRTWAILLCSLCILAIILDSKTAADAALQGISQCLYTVVPALFPFFLFSGILVNGLYGTRAAGLSRLMSLAGIPAGAECFFLIGNLGGYPVGAQCIAQAYESDCLSRQDAERLLGFCVNPGPSFLFGICSALFSQPAAAWCLWAIQIISAYLTGILLPHKCAGTSNVCHKSDLAITAALKASIRSMALVCGWIVIWRVILQFLQRWFFWLLPIPFQCLLTGLLELTNGCLQLGDVHPEQVRFVLCSAMLSIGGLCVLMQTASVTGKLGLGMYIPGKVLQGLISTLLALLVQGLLFSGSFSADAYAAPAALLAALLVAAIPFLRYSKNNGSNSIINHV